MRHHETWIYIARALVVYILIKNIQEKEKTK